LTDDLFVDRRTVVIGAAAAALLASTPAGAVVGTNAMYGLIGKMRATPGKRGDLIAILLEGTDAMPGCLAYIVAEDAAEADAIWITEVWSDETSHKASLKLPAVQAAIAKGHPMIAGFDSQTVLRPVGGVGLPRG
jgi:quinol monooxygenase YgiN